MDLSKYPMDTQTCKLQLESCKYNTPGKKKKTLTLNLFIQSLMYVSMHLEYLHSSWWPPEAVNNNGQKKTTLFDQWSNACVVIHSLEFFSVTMQFIFRKKKVVINSIFIKE